MPRIQAVLCASLLVVVSCDDGPSNPFSEYRAKSMATEALVTLPALQDEASRYVMEERLGPDGLTVETGKLPPSVGPTPAVGSCCKLPNGTCDPGDAFSSSEAWQAYLFEPSGPIRYSYEAKSEGDRITIRAIGDLDCDGVFSTYESIGQLDSGALKFGEMTKTRPLE